MTNKKPITVLEILQKIRMHVSVPQCDVFGYLSIESEIVILIIPVDHYPKALQVRFSTLRPSCQGRVRWTYRGRGGLRVRSRVHLGSWRGQGERAQQPLKGLGSRTLAGAMPDQAKPPAPLEEGSSQAVSRALILPPH